MTDIASTAFAAVGQAPAAVVDEAIADVVADVIADAAAEVVATVGSATVLDDEIDGSDADAVVVAYSLLNSFR
jgi:ribosomal protein L25 (general stress protein Ctc)